MADKTLSLATQIKLNNGLSMPQIHLGVYLMSGSEASTAVKYALDAGYRAVDSAQMYHNEKQVGNAILDYLKSHPELKREDIHYTTKLASNSDYNRARASISKSVKECGLGYIDLFLLHSPYGGKQARLDSWRAVEDAIQDGEVRIGGISNFGEKHVSQAKSITSRNTTHNAIDQGASGQQPPYQAGRQSDRGPPVQHPLKARLFLPGTRHCSGGVRSTRSCIADETPRHRLPLSKVLLHTRPALSPLELPARLCPAAEERAERKDNGKQSGGRI